MLTLRLGPKQGGIVVAAAAALSMATLPLTSAFAADREREPARKPAPKHAPDATSQNSAACQMAKLALQNFKTNDAAEDAAEREAELRNDDTTREEAEAADRAEDQAEHAQQEALKAAVVHSCEPQPSAACLAARTALKNFQDMDRAEDAAERQQDAASPKDSDAKAADKIEDQAEHAQEHPLQDAVRQNCEPGANESAACVSAKATLTDFNAKDRTEDEAERQLDKPGSDDPQAKAADNAEDQLERAQEQVLHAAVEQACGKAHR